MSKSTQYEPYVEHDEMLAMAILESVDQGRYFDGGEWNECFFEEEYEKLSGSVKINFHYEMLKQHGCFITLPDEVIQWVMKYR
jgi:hypothetical protein